MEWKPESRCGLLQASFPSVFFPGSKVSSSQAKGCCSLARISAPLPQDDFANPGRHQKVHWILPFRVWAKLIGRRNTAEMACNSSPGIEKPHASVFQGSCWQAWKEATTCSVCPRRDAQRGRSGEGGRFGGTHRSTWAGLWGERALPCFHTYNLLRQYFIRSQKGDCGVHKSH